MATSNDAQTLYRHVMDEAHRLRVEAIRTTARAGIELESGSAMWVIRMEAWRAIVAFSNPTFMISIALGRRKELIGIPVRVTVDDEPDVPMIQLVMEPATRRLMKAGGRIV